MAETANYGLYVSSDSQTKFPDWREKVAGETGSNMVKIDTVLKEHEDSIGAMDQFFISVSDGKSLIASAITDKGVATAADASFQTMKENILAIESGGGLPDGVCLINVTASTAEGGTVSGGGVASKGMTLTVAANVADGYNFEGWQEGGETISDSLEYTFNVTEDRVLVAGFSVVKPSRLPAGYTELEYIESTGAQYIDTKYKPDNLTKVVMDIKPTAQAPADGSHQYYFGQIYKYGSGNYSVYSYQASRTNNGNYCGVRAQISSDDVNNFDGNNYGEDRIKITIDAKNKEAYINNNTPYNLLNVASYFGRGINLYLFDRNTNYTSYKRNGIPSKLFSTQIYNNDILVRDFVPCQNPTGAIGLYDMVSGTFYANAGTGAFTAGPAV